MNLKRKLKYFVASFLMIASTITPLGRGLLSNVYASEAGEAPAHGKTIKDNGDGTYTIALSVTGATSSSTSTQVTKANVVLVLDTSSSMNYESGISSYYLVDGTPRDPSLDGNSDSTRPRYYRKDGTNYSRVYYRNGNWYTAQTGGQQFTGPFYAKNRIWAEKTALTEDNGIIDNLLAQNVPGDPVKNDIIEIAVVDFNNTASQDLNFTNNSSTIKSTINGLNTGSGTNWESALKQAKAYADAIKQTQQNEKTYVIFLTDGEPTRYGNGGSTNANIGTAWDNAKDDARALITSGYELYGLFTWGSSNNSHYLSSLIQYAYTGTGGNNQQLDTQYAKYFTDATDTETMIAALTQIVNNITTGVGYTNVEMTDGVTAMTVSTAKPVAGDVGGLKYYRSGGSYSTTANGGLGEEWADAPHATINSKGEVDWNLGSRVLENGVTYTVAFVVYPSQESLDLVADLNNGAKSYDSLDQDVKDQIVKVGDSYTLKTNTDYPTLTYSTVTTTTVNGQTTTDVSDTKTINMTNPDPVELYQEEAELQKLWEDALDPSQREEEVGDIYLQFYKKDFNQTQYVEYDQFHENYDATKGGIKVKKVSGSDTWSSGKISIAPGLMVSEGHEAYDENTPYGVVTMNGKKYAVLNPGHDYKFGEDDINSHFELTNYIYHPMLVDGTLMNVTFTRSGNTFTGVESAKEMSAVSATNTIKGGINIEKKVLDENNNVVNDAKDAFKVKAYLKGVGDYCEGDAEYCDYNYDYRIYYGQNNPKYNNPEEYSSSGAPRSGHKYGAGVFEETLYVGDVIRVVNVNDGTLYYVEESNIPKGYSLDKIDYLIKEYTVEEGETPQDKTDTVAKSIDSKDYYAVVGNAASSAIVTNKYVSGDLQVSKAVNVTSGNATTAKAAEFTFTFKLYTDNTKTTEITGTPYKIDGTDKTIKSGDTFKLKDGESIKILQLPEGAYYEITEAEVAGYTASKTGDTGTIVKNQTQKANFVNTYSVSGKVKVEVKKDFDDWRTGDNFVFKLNGDGIEEEMSASINGAGKVAEFEIEINDIGTYEYTISEDFSEGVRGGISQVSGNITASVTATDNGKGGLEFNVTYQGGEGEKLNTIVNRYTATGSIWLGASKILTGRDWQEGELYTFTLIGPDSQEIDSQDVSETKKDVVFSEISYTTEDAGKTFVYTIHESTPLPGGVTNSGDITATVTVEDNHDGTLKTTVVYSGGQGEKYNTIVNTYSAEGEFNLEATKKLVGRGWLSGEKYNFVLKDENGEVVDTQTVDANETINFKNLKFTQADAGEHKYTITETGTMPNGLSKSADIQVTLTVTDDGEGNLSFEADYSNNATITNTYEATGEVELQATKVLEGRDWRENESFDFELSGNNITSETIAVTEAKPTAKFTKIKYDQTDAGKTYTYTIKETTNLTGMSIVSSGDITVTVKLTDDGAGNIVPEVTYSKQDQTIKNTYSASGEVVLSAEKKLEGRNWKNGESYTFALKDKDGETIDTKTVSQNGSVSFKKLEYTKIGTYKYTIEETTEMSNGMSNSGAIEVTVEVTDNYDGTLTATPTYKDNNKTIVNTYKASGKVQLEATKALEGRDWKDGESFTFELFKGSESLGQKTVTKSSPKAVFDEIKYTEADIDAEYVYTIKEVGTLPNSVTSSGDVTVYVNITDNGDGTLGVVTDYINGGTITNTYEASGKVRLEATKAIEGRDWLDSDEFTFELSGEGIETQTKTVKKGQEKAVFDEIKYSEADAGKTYTYTIKETTDLSGLSMTASGEVTATVKVVDDGNGNLETEVSYTSNDKITNTYTAKGEVELKAEKKLEGRDWLEGESYDFVLSGKDGEIDRQAVDANETVTFNKINYTEADAGKTYTYTITEDGELKAGLSKSGNITATVKLTDDGKGNIKAEVEYSNNDLITNTYKAKGQIELKIEKELEGRDWLEGESYTFDLKDETETLDSKSISKNGKVSFKAIEYTEIDAGHTYNYTISEQDNLPNGITSSGDVTVKVKITDNGDGTLKAEAEYSKDGKIVNTYTASGKAKLEATKVIEGRDWLDSDEFTFELSGEGIETQTKTVKKGQEKTIFDEIKYSESDAGKTYTYTIKETTDLSNLSMTSSGSITATVKVTDDGEGNLSTEVSYTNSDKITNTYTAKGEVELKAEKKLEGRDWLEGESYEFILSGKDGEIDRKTVDSNETVTFKKINYTEADAGKTHTYTIAESDDLKSGLTGSGSITATVKLTDDGKGKISAEVEYSNEDVITNTYKAKGEIALEIEKELTGRDWQDGESYEFALSDKDGEIDRKSIDKNGKVSFKTIEYTEADAGKTFNYTIKEVSELPSGISGSGDVTVTVKVEDNGDGTLKATAEYSKDGKIVNDYDAAGSIQLEATKAIEGRDWLDSDEFTFELSGEGIETQTKTVKKGQEKVTFDEIKYDEADAGKTYTYTIKETTDLSGLSMTNSGSITATVKVTDNGNGTLKAEASYTNSGKITNTYTAKGEVELKAEKKLEGRDWLEGESYDFVLSGDEGEIDRKAVDANEAVTFKKIEYTEADAGKTYTYTITEDGELKAGLTKSGDITVTVKLTDDGKGKISAEVSYTNDGKITNTYETKPVEVEKPFTVKKKINDQSNSKKDASFKFELRDKDNKAVQTKEVTTKDLVGSVDFDAIKFDKADTYEYTLVEINDGQAGFSYEGPAPQVVFEVTDDYEKAQLVAKVTIDGKEVGEVEFKNDYKAKATSTEIGIEKILSGSYQDLSKEFEFILSDKNGVIQTIKIKGSGKAEFDTIKFEKVDDYIYTVKEVKGNAKGYTYDESEYTVTVKVSDNNAQLEAEVSYQKDGEDAEAIVFVNSYEPEKIIYGCPECKVQLGVKKVLEKRDLKDKEFKFNVYLGGELIATGYNTADGKVVLNEGITLDETGTYNFIIKEDTENREQDITYDESEYSFTVEVIDDGSGELKVVSDTSSNVTFTNKYNEPGKGNTPSTPKTPYTYDGIMTSVATLVISLVGLVGSLFVGKRYLKKEEN